MIISRGSSCRQRLRTPFDSGTTSNVDQVIARSQKHRPGSSNSPSAGQFRSNGDKPVVVATALDLEPAPFFEPMIRCFLLGVAFGGLFEAVTVLSQVLPLSASTPSALSPPSPTYLNDTPSEASIEIPPSGSRECRTTYVKVVKSHCSRP